MRLSKYSVLEEPSFLHFVTSDDLHVRGQIDLFSLPLSMENKAMVHKMCNLTDLIWFLFAFLFYY
jgi:hypothetical protein